VSPLFAVLPFVVTNVCPVGCDHTDLQSAVDSVPLGGTVVAGIDIEILDGATRIDGGRNVTVVPYVEPVTVAVLLQALQAGDTQTLDVILTGIDTVTLTHSESTGEPTIEVDQASLTLLGVGVDGGLTRAIEATDSNLLMGVTTVFGRGVAADGGLVRVERGSLTVNGGGFHDGSAAGPGGLVAVYDADASFHLTAFTNGGAARGACLHVAATDTTRELSLVQTSFRSCEASIRGGGAYLLGPIDTTISGSTFTDNSSAEGGALALVGAGLVATLDATAIDGNLAFSEGGGIYIQNADVTFREGNLSANSAFYGGAIAMHGASQLTLEGAHVDRNGALFDGGGLYIAEGTYRATDTNLYRNVATSGEGGGLWLDEPAVWAEDVRSTICGNQASEGGGIWASLGSPTTASNLRLLDNLAERDGGGLYHAGEELELSFANLLGNSAGRGSGAAALSTGALTLTNVLIGYNLGSVAVVPRLDDARVTLGPTTWFGNERGDLDGLSPTTEGALFEDPLLDRYVAGNACELSQDWPTWNSPMRNAGTPSIDDLDDTRADIGAYGGPLADPSLWETDRDMDGMPQIYDCDDGNPDVNPSQIDEPYDGIDADCRFDDDFDADRDGFRRIDDGGTDCDDTRDDIYPGAPEDPATFEDANCDGLLDADGDGFERRTNSSEEGELDCDDGNPDVYPGAPELGADADYNCDGFIDGPRIYQLSGCQSAPAVPWWPRRRR